MKKNAKSVLTMTLAIAGALTSPLRSDEALAASAAAANLAATAEQAFRLLRL